MNLKIGKRYEMNDKIVYKDVMYLKVTVKTKGFCHGCNEKEQSLAYESQLWYNKLFGYAKKGFCKKCVKSYEMRPFFVIKYNDEYFNLTKNWIASYCSICDVNNTTFHQSFLYDKHSVCHDCATGLQVYSDSDSDSDSESESESKKIVFHEINKYFYEPNTYIYPLYRLRYLRDNNPDQFCENSALQLQIGENYLAKGYKCACNYGACIYARNELNKKYNMKKLPFISFNGKRFSKVYKKSRGFCHDCHQIKFLAYDRERKNPYNKDLMNTILYDCSKEGICKKCIKYYMMKPFSAIKIDGRIYNLSKHHFSRCCYECRADIGSVDAFEYVYSTYVGTNCCYSCAKKLQFNEDDVDFVDVPDFVDELDLERLSLE